MIEVRRTEGHDPLVFEVVVRDGSGESRHHVTMSRATCERLTAGKHTPERCVDAAFRFLLDRERKDELLPWLQRLRDEVALPMVYVSHSPEETARLADAVYRVD